MKMNSKGNNQLESLLISKEIKSTVRKEASVESSIRAAELARQPGAIKMENVATTYSGKTGCACGCRGKYVKAGSSVASKRVAFVNANLDRVQIDFLPTWVCYSVENDNGTRVTRVYVRNAK